MPLESCMILLDCSQYMRNGDYIPTRLEAQQDAANVLVGAKTQSHPESTVGVSAGTDLLVSPTVDVGKILTAVHQVEMSASDAVDIPTAVSVASLALKHRRNKNGAQRIVLFVGTPVTADVKSLQKAGRLLKKNNVAIDVVALGELDRNEPVLQELVDAANGRSAGGAGNEDSERTCHLVSIPPGVLPSDVLASSPVLAGSGGAFAAAAAAGFAAAGASGGNANDDGFDFGGVDPNMDPELAMALRVSMEEERARQERVAAAAAAAAAASTSEGSASANDASGDAEMADSNTADTSTAAAAAAAAEEAGLSEEEALLQQALAMSMNENDPEETTTGGVVADNNDTKPAGADDDEMEEDDDEAMQMALQMSMVPDTDASSAAAPAAAAAEFQDPAFVNQMLQNMPGVDPNDPNIQEMLKKAAEEKKKDEQK